MSALTVLKRRAQAFIAAFVAVAIASSPAFAMRVSPMVVEMESRGSDAVARVEVQNVNQGNLAFETRVFLMTIADDGAVVETPADDKFLIFPPQGVLPPGGRQVVRLQWVGEPDLAASQAFYISVEQLPVALEPTVTETVAAQVQVLYNMRALAVVAPPGARPNVHAASVRQVNYQPPADAGSQGLPAMQDGVEITLKNDGRRHAMMSAFGWRLEGTDTAGQGLRVDISAEELTQAVGTGYVPALGERTFRVPVPGFGPEPIKLSFIQ